MDQSVEAKRDNSEALELLRRLKSEVFEDSDDGLALALGRELAEIQRWQSGDENIDEDADMKIHGLAKERLSE